MAEPWRARRNAATIEPFPAPETPTVVEHELRRFPLSVVSRWAVTLALTTVVAWWSAVGVFWVGPSALGLTALITLFAAAVYNLYAAFLGGIRVDAVERVVLTDTSLGAADATEAT